LVRLKNFLTRTALPLNKVSDVTVAAINETVKTLDDTAWISTGLSSVKDRIRVFRTLYGSKTGMTWVGASINSTLAQISTNVDPIVDNAAGTVDALTGKLVPVRGTIVGIVDMAVGMLSSLNDTTDGIRGSLVGLKDQQSSLALFQTGGVLAIFIVAIVFLAAGWCGMCAGE
jgi:hypothetical protein